MYEHSKNRISINGNELVFDKDILEIIDVDDGVLILLEATEETDLDLLFLYNKNGGLIWQIKKPNKEYLPKKQLPYVGITEQSGQYWVVDFMGFIYYFDIETGEITGSKFVR